MLTATAPTRSQIVEKVTGAIPRISANTGWSEQNRRMHDDTLAALAEAGVFRLRTPRRFGGYEADTRTLVDVAAAIARADGSAAWTASVYWIPAWMAGLFPDAVQDEVFATPDARICGTLSPSAMAAPADGGIVVNGRWGFITGAWDSQWQEIIAIQAGPGSEPFPVMALVPTADLTLVDDWHTAGLQGTGSVSTVAEDLFVPAERVLPLGAVLQGESASQSGAASPMYRAPLLPVASASSVGTMVGLARAALETFLERLPGRKITYTAYATQAEAPLTHLQVADAAMKIDEAEFHAYRLADLVDGRCAQGEPFTLADRVRARADMGATGRLAREAVQILQRASGGSSIYRDVPMQRILRDIQTVTLHALMNPDTNAELYGRLLCGLEPNTLYV